MHSWAAKKPGMGAAEKLRHLLDSGFQFKNATKNIQRGELWVYTRYIHLQFGYVRYIHLQFANDEFHEIIFLPEKLYSWTKSRTLTC